MRENKKYDGFNDRCPICGAIVSIIEEDGNGYLVECPDCGFEWYEHTDAIE
jgi:uncharacterized Zn finger protein